jgi:hypothetical protein
LVRTGSAQRGKGCIEPIQRRQEVVFLFFGQPCKPTEPLSKVVHCGCVRIVHGFFGPVTTADGHGGIVTSKK